MPDKLFAVLRIFQVPSVSSTFHWADAQVMKSFNMTVLAVQTPSSWTYVGSYLCTSYFYDNIDCNLAPSTQAEDAPLSCTVAVNKLSVLWYGCDKVCMENFVANVLEVLDHRCLRSIPGARWIDGVSVDFKICVGRSSWGLDHWAWCSDGKSFISRGNIVDATTQLLRLLLFF